MRPPLRSSAEQDVIYARDVYCWTQRPGATAWWKRNIRRRERRDGRREAREAS